MAVLEAQQVVDAADAGEAMAAYLRADVGVLGAWILPEAIVGEGTLSATSISW